MQNQKGKLKNEKPTLTIKQEKFVAKYSDGGDASAAYRFAFDAKGMKPETVNRRAYDLLHMGKIQARVAEFKQKMLDKLAVKPEKTLKRLMQGQEFDIRKMYHPDGRLKSPHELDDDTAKAVVGVKYDAIGQLEYKIIDVKGCTELLGKHLKLFVDKVEHSWDGDCPLSGIVLEASNRSKDLPDPAPDEDDD